MMIVINGSGSGPDNEVITFSFKSVDLEDSNGVIFHYAFLVFEHFLNLMVGSHFSKSQV